MLYTANLQNIAQTIYMQIKNWQKKQVVFLANWIQVYCIIGIPTVTRPIIHSVFPRRKIVTRGGHVGSAIGWQGGANLNEIAAPKQMGTKKN